MSKQITHWGYTVQNIFKEICSLEISRHERVYSLVSRPWTQFLKMLKCLTSGCHIKGQDPPGGGKINMRVWQEIIFTFFNLQCSCFCLRRRTAAFELNNLNQGRWLKFHGTLPKTHFLCISRNVFLVVELQESSGRSPKTQSAIHYRPWISIANSMQVWSWIKVELDKRGQRFPIISKDLEPWLSMPN